MGTHGQGPKADLECKKGDVIVVTSRGGPLWQGYLLHHPDERGAFLPDWVVPLYAHEGFSSEAQESVKYRRATIERAGGDETDSEPEGGAYGSGSDTAEGSDHDTLGGFDGERDGERRSPSRRGNTSRGGSALALADRSSHAAKAAHR